LTGTDSADGITGSGGWSFDERSVIYRVSSHIRRALSQARPHRSLELAFLAVTHFLPPGSGSFATCSPGAPPRWQGLPRAFSGGRGSGGG
jgi:hypothetical protein